MPRWYSQMLPLSYDLGVEIGKFRGKIAQQLDMGFGKEEIVGWIHSNYPVDRNTANALFSYCYEQYAYTDTIPTHDNITIERTFDDEGRVNLVFHTIYGRRANDALSRVFAEVISKQFSINVGITIDDPGFVLVLPQKVIEIQDVLDAVYQQDVEELLKNAVRRTEIMKRRFRHVAGRALMILRSYKGRQKSVGKQQMQSHFLLHACEKIDPEFPIILETYREIMEDAMDLPHAQEVLDNLKAEEWGYTYIEKQNPSPFAQNLVLQGQSDAVLLEDRKKRLQELHKRVMAQIPDSE